ncbi:MAG: outer membrane beta-barrel protein [Verrucomicrobiota bacterium]|jgi:hypothetical protein
MKLNKWTLGLAAVGVISLASAARADEKMNSLQTALSNTTISGYVSASFNWAITPGDYQNSPAGAIPFQGYNAATGNTYGKENGFNLDVVKLSIAKPQDESPWASGYQVDLLFGPDAVGYNPVVQGQSSSYVNRNESYAIKQAYVSLRTPIGNGIDWKVGVFDSIIGYEVFDAGSNPNYTRSWGYAVEPTELTGILASYKINDQWSVSAGIANTLMAGINNRAWDYQYYNGNVSRDWNKAFLGSVTFTAPSNWAWAAGSSFYAGIVYGFAGGYWDRGNDWGDTGFYANGNQVNYYLGATLNTPWKQLTVGGALDYVHNLGGGGTDFSDTWHNDVSVLGLYATCKATDKLSLNGRAEYIHGQYDEQFLTRIDDDPTLTTVHRGYSSEAFEVTGTVEYDLWANVISRLELRWDRFGSFRTPEALMDVGRVDNKYAVGFYANVIYKF